MYVYNFICVCVGGGGGGVGGCMCVCFQLTYSVNVFTALLLKSTIAQMKVQCIPSKEIDR